jgi:phage anti-repressor protein/phage antirepressor YoqD-like protein
MSEVASILPAIIPSDMGGKAALTCNARDLHAFLGVGKDFPTWIKDRIERFDFTEGQDFVVVERLSSPNSGSAKSRPQMLKEYLLTLDMAKELAMVENNEKGREARRYFIRAEAELRERQAAVDPLAALRDPDTLRGLLLDYSGRVKALESEKAALEPKADALDRIAAADGALSITAAAKALQMRPKDLFTYLHANGWIYRRAGGGGYLGYQSKTTQGLLEHRVTTLLRSDGTEKIVEQVLVTAKGMTKLAMLLNELSKHGADRGLALAH